MTRGRKRHTAKPERQYDNVICKLPVGFTDPPRPPVRETLQPFQTCDHDHKQSDTAQKLVDAQRGRQLAFSERSFYTIAEVAERLKITSEFVRILIHNGDLQAYRFGKVIRIADDDIAGFLQTRRTRTGSSRD